jgi:hypothetical protein
VWRLTLASSATLAIETTDAAGTCDADTRLFLVDRAVLDTLGYGMALLGASDFDNNSGVGYCSRLVLTLPAGDHYFVVDESGADHAAAYVLRAVPIRGAGNRCDPHGYETYCGLGLYCLDPDANGDGACN